MSPEKFEKFGITEQVKREYPDIEEKREVLKPEKVEELSQELAELAAEKALLGRLLYLETGQPRAKREVEKREEKEVLGFTEELEAIKQGKVDLILKQEDKTQKEIVEENERRLEEVEAKIKELVAYPQVREHYQKEFVKKVEIIQAAREIEKLKQLSERIRSEEGNLLVKREKERLSKADEKILDRNKKRQRAIEERIISLEQNPEVVTEECRRELLDYKRQLEKNDFVETPEIKKIMKELEFRVRIGQPVLLWGHTGSGKTEDIIHFSERYLGREPEVFSGGEEVTQYDLFGRAKLTGFEYGPLPRALKNDKPLLIDEIDLIPHGLLGEFHHLLTRRPGDKITIPGIEEKFTIPKHFIVFATGNIKSPKYRREDLDPALLRRFHEIEIKYPSREENRLILLAYLIDRKGGLTLGGPEDIEKINRLCQAAEFVQQVYTGEKTDFYGEGAVATRGKGSTLEKATLSIGDLLKIVKIWKTENFQKPLDDYVLSEIIRPQTVRKDQLNLIKIFSIHGFFKDYKPEDFDIPGLTEEKLLAYRAAE